MANFTVQFGYRNTMNASLKMDSDCFRRLLRQVEPNNTQMPAYESAAQCMELLTFLIQRRNPETINGLGVSAWIDFAQIQLVACSLIPEAPVTN